MAGRGLPTILSYAGRVQSPRPQPVPTRVGGFGGAEGLADWLRAHRIARMVDATHPFAARISRNAVEAARLAGVPLLAFQRPPWQPGPGDNWRHVPDMEGAVRALDGLARRVFLSIGCQHLADFAGQPQHHYLLRLVDRPTEPLPLPQATLVIDRGPFEAEADRLLLERHRIEVIVAKNAGGAGASAKLAAARALGIPVVMIARPALPDRLTAATVADVLEWCHADLGV